MAFPAREILYFFGAGRHRYFLPMPKILCKRKKAPSSITAEKWLFQLAQMSSFFCERLTIQNQPISLCKHKVVMFAPVYIRRTVTHINIQSIPLLGIVRRRSYRCRVVNGIRLSVCIAAPVYFPDFFRRSLACSCSSMSLFQNACTLSNSSCEGGFSCAPPSARRASSEKANPFGSRRPYPPRVPTSSPPFCIALVSADLKTVA